MSGAGPSRRRRRVPQPLEICEGVKTEIFQCSMAGVLLCNYTTEAEGDPMDMDSDNNNNSDDERLLALGMFFINVISQSANTIYMTYCSIDDFHWPLTKDIAVIRMAERTFYFGFPGLLYALQIPNIINSSLLGTLQFIFLEHAHYLDYKDINPVGNVYPLVDEGGDFWRTIRPIVQPLAHNILTIYNHQPGQSRFCVSNYNSCFLRAARLSAATKIMIDAMTSGSLLPNHTLIETINYRYSEHNAGRASATIATFIGLVDALEASVLLSHDLAVYVVNALPPIQTYFNPSFKLWRLNQNGYVVFMAGLDKAVALEVADITRKTAPEPANRDDNDNNNDSSRGMDKGKQVARP